MRCDIITIHWIRQNDNLIINQNRFLHIVQAQKYKMSTSSLSNDTTTSVVMDNNRSLAEINEARKGEICPESENYGSSSNPVQVHIKKIIYIYLIHS